MRLSVPERTSAVETALVHAPIALFAVPFPPFAVAALFARGPLRIGAAFCAWWLASGAAMMIVDARARMDRYRRVVAATEGRASRTAPPGLRQTVCGLFMSWALRYRRSAGNRSNIRKGVEA